MEKLWNILPYHGKRAKRDKIIAQKRNMRYTDSIINKESR